MKERDDGIVITGAQQLATGGVLSDWVYLSCIHPLPPGDENYANCVAVPINAPGVKLYPAPALSRCAPTNSFDYPLSSRFDESDSYVVFDNVFVPWEHVFIYRNLEITRDQWWKTPSHVYGNHQAQVRYVTKLRFMMGLAQRMIEMTGSAGNPAVQIAMGEIAALASIYEGMLLAHEVNAPIENGVLWPSKTTLYAAMAHAVGVQRPDARDHPRAGRLGGDHAAVFGRGLRQSGNGADIERYMRSGSMDARSRTALVRMLWDFLGSEFGSRHQQYEKFYGGASFLVKQNVYRNYDFKRATALVDQGAGAAGRVEPRGQYRGMRASPYFSIRDPNSFHPRLHGVDVGLWSRPGLGREARAVEIRIGVVVEVHGGVDQHAVPLAGAEQRRIAVALAGRGIEAEPEGRRHDDDVVLAGVHAVSDRPVDRAVVVDVDVVVHHGDVLVAHVRGRLPQIALAACLAWLR